MAIWCQAEGNRPKPEAMPSPGPANKQQHLCHLRSSMIKPFPCHQRNVQVMDVTEHAKLRQGRCRVSGCSLESICYLCSCPKSPDAGRLRLLRPDTSEFRLGWGIARVRHSIRFSGECSEYFQEKVDSSFGGIPRHRLQLRPRACCRPGTHLRNTNVWSGSKGADPCSWLWRPIPMEATAGAIRVKAAMMPIESQATAVASSARQAWDRMGRAGVAAFVDPRPSPAPQVAISCPRWSLAMHAFPWQCKDQA